MLATWEQVMGEPTVEDSCRAEIDDFSRTYDIEGLANDWRERINEALPENVDLFGDEFYGPANLNDLNLKEIHIAPDGSIDLKAAVAATLGPDGIWFGYMAEKHDHTGEADWEAVDY